MHYRIPGVALMTNDIDSLKNILPSNVEEYLSALCFVYCRKGELNVLINDRPYRLRPRQLMLCRLQSLMDDISHTPDFEATVVCTNEKLFDEIKQTIIQLEPYWWEKQMFLRDNPILDLNNRQIRLLDAYVNLVTVYLETSPNAYQQNVIRLMAQACCLEALAFLDDEEVIKRNKDMLDKNGTASQGEQTFRKFIDLMYGPGVIHRDTLWYADKLAITPKYLAAICKQRSGKTAFRLINDMCLEQIKHTLVYTDTPIKEMADKFDFPNASFFCKYVREHLGVTPQQFRKQNR